MTKALTEIPGDAGSRGSSEYQYNPEITTVQPFFISAIIPWLSRFFLGKTSGDLYGLNDYTVVGSRRICVATIWLALLLRKRSATIELCRPPG